MVRCRDIPALLDLAYSAIRDGLCYDRVGLVLLDRERGQLVEHIGTDAHGQKFYPKRVNPLSCRYYEMILSDPRMGLGGAGFMRLEDASREVPPEYRQFLDGQPQELLRVALRTTSGVIGMISVDNLVSARPISPHDAPPIVAFANALATAVENVALLREREQRIEHLDSDLRRRIEQLTWLQEAGKRLSGAYSLEDVLDTVYWSVRDGLGYDRVGIFLVEEDDQNRRYLREFLGTDKYGQPCASWSARDYLDDPQLPLHSPDIHHLLQGHSWYYCPDRWASTPEDYRGTIEGRMREQIAVALRHDDPMIGMISVDNLISGRPITSEDAPPLVAFASQAAVAISRARLYADAARWAEHDALTGLLNHRALLREIDAHLERDAAFALLLIDVDNFKLFNDTHGHPTGDDVLRRVATTLQETCRGQDIAGRYGGDEFALLVDGAGNEEAGAIAQRLHAGIESHPYLAADGTVIPLSISVGWACYPPDGQTRPSLIAVADAAMYAAKHGRQRAPDRAAADLLGDSPFGVLEGLVNAVDAKDHYTCQHSEDVTRQALTLAEALDLSAEERRILSVAARLHDVGKIAVPDRILRKPGRLTAEEDEILKRHVTFGVAIIKGVLDDQAVVDAVAYHHERWDGHGYPYGRSGLETPLLGRIMQVADAVSAMTMDRPYRRALSPDQVVAELKAGAGRQFDPTLVDVFVAVIGYRYHRTA